MMIRLFLYITILCFAQISFSADLTTLTLKEKDGVTTNNYPLTFGHVFKRSDVAQYVTASYDGIPLNTQCDVKATYDNGSVRFAVISVVIPSVVANSTKNIVLSTSATTSSSGYMDKAAIIATNIEDEIRLTNISGSGYSGNLTADLNAKIASDATPTYWLQGSIATEVLVRQALNTSLESSWEVRFYPGTSFGPRISHSIENMNADYRGIVNYDVDIQAGLPTLSSRYSKSTVQHNENSRWRKIVWIGSEPPETELHYDLPYLISTGAVMNYDTSLTIPESTIASAYSVWSATNHDIMGNGVITKYFPQTGGRPEIGILPTWAARYLLSWDNRLREIVTNSGEMYAHAPVHYRENNNTKSFYRHPVSIDDRPTIWTTTNLSSTYGDIQDRLPDPIGLYGSAQHGWTIDHAHQSSQAYIPYLITGERYFLDEMYYWASWCLSTSNYVYRGGSSGILIAGGANDVLQTRGVAWALRNIADAAAFAPDSDIEKGYLESKISNNINTFSGYSNNNPLKFWNYHETITQAQSEVEFNTIDGIYVKNFISPWMNDFLILALAHVNDLKYDTTPVLNWFSSFVINRFTAPGFNHFNGSLYHLAAKLSDNSYIADWNTVGLRVKTDRQSFTGDGTASNYDFIAMASAAVVTAYTNGQDAYNFLKANVQQQDLLNIDPTWAILPITSGLTCNNGIQDGEETGIDCGGSCGACSTPTLLIPTSYRIPGGVPYGIVQ